MREFFAAPLRCLDLSRPLKSVILVCRQSIISGGSPYNSQITLEDDSVVDVRGINMEIRIAGNEEHLDQVFDIAIDTTDADDEFRAAFRRNTDKYD